MQVMTFTFINTIFKRLALYPPHADQSMQHLTQWHHKQQQHIHRKSPVFSDGSVNTIADYIHQVNAQPVH